MRKAKVQILDEQGFHARPAVSFIQMVSRFKSHVQVAYGEQCVDGRSIFDLMTLRVHKGDIIELMVEGDDEKEMMHALMNFFEEHKNGSLRK